MENKKIIILVVVGLVVLFLIFGQKSQKDQLFDEIDSLGTEIGKILDVPPKVWTNWRDSLKKQPLTVDELKEYTNRLKDKLFTIKVQRGLA